MRSVDDAARAILDIATRDQVEKVEAFPEAEPVKLCSKCGPTKGPKPLAAFDKHPGCRDGHHSICKQCRANHGREVRRQKNEAKSGTKLCIKCGPEKGPLPIAKFYRNGGTKDGRDTTCKDCLREAAKAKRIAKRGYEYKCPQCGAEHAGRPTAKGLSRICSICEPPEEEVTMFVASAAQQEAEAATEPTESAPVQVLQILKGELNKLWAVEVLEYEDENLLAGDNKMRSETKQRILERCRDLVADLIY